MNNMTASTTFCFTPSADVLADSTNDFLVQVVGIDPAGMGITYSTLDRAMEYATRANSNGFACFIHLM